MDIKRQLKCDKSKTQVFVYYPDKALFLSRLPHSSKWHFHPSSFSCHKPWSYPVPVSFSHTQESNCKPLLLLLSSKYIQLTTFHDTHDNSDRNHHHHSPWLFHLAPYWSSCIQPGILWILNTANEVTQIK